MSEETGTNVGPRGHISDQPSSVNAVDPAEQLAMLRNLAFSNFVANTNLSQQNAVSNQQAMNEIGLTVVGKLVNFIIASHTEQALDSESGAGNDVAPQLTNLKTVLVSEVDTSPDYSRAIDEVEHANRVFNANLEQQNALQRRQAYFQIQLAAIAKCVVAIMSVDSSASNAADQQRVYREMLDRLLEQAKPEIEQAGLPS